MTATIKDLLSLVWVIDLDLTLDCSSLSQEHDYAISQLNSS